MSEVVPIEDARLLANFASQGSHDAFRQIVERHGKWVFAAAYRQLRDRHMAEDAVQVVFILLAKRADAMSNGAKLSGWLFTTLQYTVKNMRRMQYRREKYERNAAEMTVPAGEARENMSDLSLRLDAAVQRLSKQDRTAIVLRFYRDCSFEQIGAMLGVSEPAARKRVARAVGALRAKLKTNSAMDAADILAASTAGLALVPANFTSHVTTVAMAAKAGAGIPASIMTLTKGTGWLMTAAKLQMAVLVAAAVTVAVGGPVMWTQLHAAPPAAASAVSDAEWAKFKAACALAPGEYIKHISDAPEREAAYKAMTGATGNNALPEWMAQQIAAAQANATQPGASQGMAFRSVPATGGAARRGGGGGGGMGGAGQANGGGGMGGAGQANGGGGAISWNGDPATMANAGQKETPIAMIVTYDDGKPLKLFHEQHGNWRGQGGMGLQASQLLEILLQVQPIALEDDIGLAGHVIPGDFVVRAGSTPEQIRVGLEKMFSEAFKTNVNLKYKDVDEISYALKGTWAYKPVAGQEAGGTPTIHLYGQEMGPKRGNGNGGTSDPNHHAMFLRPLSQLLKSPVTMDAKGVPESLSFEVNAVPGGAVDVKAVLDHLTEQTGLTWTEETKKAKHLVVEMAPEQ